MILDAFRLLVLLADPGKAHLPVPDLDYLRFLSGLPFAKSQIDERVGEYDQIVGQLGHYP